MIPIILDKSFFVGADPVGHHPAFLRIVVIPDDSEIMSRKIAFLQIISPIFLLSVNNRFFNAAYLLLQKSV